MNLRTIIIFALLMCACILPLHAQVGEQRHNFAVGVNGGINLNSVSFSPSIKQKNPMGIKRWCDSPIYLRRNISA